MPKRGSFRVELAAHLRRCGVIYIVGVVVLCLLNSLIFTVTQPRVPTNETISVLMINQESLSEEQMEALQTVVCERVPHVRSLLFETLWYDRQQIDLNMVLPVKLMAGDYDLLISDARGHEALEAECFYLPLEGYLKNDPLAAETVQVKAEETGETYIGAIRTDILGMRDVYVGIALASDNPDDAWAALGVLLENGGENK